MFLLKLNDAEAEAAEIQTWIAFAVSCEYLSENEGDELATTYDQIIGKLVRMINDPASWLIPPKKA